MNNTTGVCHKAMPKHSKIYLYLPTNYYENAEFFHAGCHTEVVFFYKDVSNISHTANISMISLQASFSLKDVTDCAWIFSTSISTESKQPGYINSAWPQTAVNNSSNVFTICQPRLLLQGNYICTNAADLIIVVLLNNVTSFTSPRACKFM